MAKDSARERKTIRPRVPPESRSIINGQTLHLNLFTHYNHDYVGYAFLKEGSKFDVELVYSIANEILASCETLRSVYVKDAIGWRQIPETDNKLRLSVDRRSAESLEAVRDVIRKEAKDGRVDSPPHLRVILFDTSRGQVLCILVHHIACDGIGAKALVDAFSAAYVQRKPIQSLDLLSNYPEYFDLLQGVFNNKSTTPSLDYWLARRGQPPVFLAQDGKVSSQLYKNFSLIQIRFPDGANLLAEYFLRLNAPFHSGLTTLYLNALEGFYGSGVYPFWMIDSGRVAKNGRFSRTVGFLNFLRIVYYDISGRTPLDVSVSENANSFRCSEDGALPFASCYWGNWQDVATDPTAATIRSLSTPEILVNYIGRITDFAKSPLGEKVELDHLVSGENPRCFNLEFKTLITGNDVVTAVRYDRAVIPDVAMAMFYMSLNKLVSGISSKITLKVKTRLPNWSLDVGEPA